MNNTTTKEKFVVGGALVGGLLFFGFLANTCQNPFNSNNKSDSVVTSYSTSTQQCTKCAPGQCTCTKAKGTKSSCKCPKDACKCSKPKTQAKTACKCPKGDCKCDKPKTAANCPSCTEKQDKLNAFSLKFDKLNSDYTALHNDYAALKAKFDAAKASSKQASEYLAQISQLKITNTKLTDQLNKLKAEKAKLAATSGAVSPQVTAKITALQNEVKQLQLKLEAAKASPQPAAGLAKLQAEIKQLKANNEKSHQILTQSLTQLKVKNQQLQAKDQRIKTLLANINQLKAANNVFVRSADQLPKNAQGLFADLKTLEGKSQNEINAAYSNYLNKYGATAKARIKFATGSSNVSAADLAKIKALTAAAGENAYFLIVGYADLTGSAASNQKLSSKRATSVAKELGKVSKGFQAAQAVYLGQTGRFGPASENRVVEIWQIN